MKATFALFLLAAACAPSVPAEPTWVDDVRPILAANCIRCHSPPYIAGVPRVFRLDKYDDEMIEDSPFDDDDEPDLIGGAGGYPSTIASQVEQELMPPRFPLTGRQIDVLVTWNEVGAPHGEPRPDNALPTMTLSGDIQVSDDRVALSYEIDDADGDIVTGLLIGDPGGGADPDPIVVSNELFVGRGFVKGVLPTGTYEIMAQLDDGHGTVDVELGTAVVP
jgi:hypothetical protein